MDDLISRQDVLLRIDNAISQENRGWVLHELKTLRMCVEHMPSAQSEIIRCKDCEFWTHIKRTKRHWCKTDDGLYGLNTFADDFCSRARRRTDGSDR